MPPTSSETKKPSEQPIEPPTEKKTRRHKYGVDDEQMSLGDARSKFGEPMWVFAFLLSNSQLVDISKSFYD